MDSKLFVTDLAEAYRKYGQSFGFTSETLTEENGHVIIKFRGRGVYQAFKNETGGHCVQRIPPTETRGRKQTSMISVAVLPLPPQDPRTMIAEKDLEIIAQTGYQKAGGQNVNKVASAIQCVYKPDPTIRVFINGWDQHRNKEEAIKIINARVREKQRQSQGAAYATLRRESLGSGGRGSKIRTYNFMESRVTNHRLGTKTTNIQAVMRGQFQLILQ